MARLLSSIVAAKKEGIKLKLSITDTYLPTFSGLYYKAKAKLATLQQKLKAWLHNK